MISLREFRSIFDGVAAEQLDNLEDDEEYGWIVAGAADELHLLPDDPRLFKSDSQLAEIPEDKLIDELGSACICNDVHAVDYLAKRVDVNTLDHHKQLPIGYAVGNNHIECVQALLIHGADPNRVQNWGVTAMHDAIGSSKPIWQLPVANGGDPKAKNDDGQTAIELLLEVGNSDWM